MKYYSPTTKGFYTNEVHGDNMPSDVIEVNGSDYDLLMEGQANGLIIHYDGRKIASISADSLLTSSALSANAKARLKQNAQIELDKTDLVVLRCLKAGVTYPTAWQTYTTSLRSIVNGTDKVSTTLPIMPNYPSGT